MPAYDKTRINIFKLPNFSRVPKGLPWLFDATSLAYSLGVRTRTITYLIVKRKENYSRSLIPKKSGGVRVIHAPSERLKFVQTRVLENILNKLEYPEHISAYVKNRKTRTSAEKHAGKPLLIVMDLKDFFTTTKRSWIRHVLQKELNYPFAVSGLLSDLMTVPIETVLGTKYVVPQGAPTSGAICNLVANERIDRQLLKLCEEWDMSYTRYADDLAFSCKERLDKRKTNKFIKQATKIIKQGGYAVNYKKLRVIRSGRQQRLLGMTINEKPNIIRKHYHQMRARIHHCQQKGFDKVAEEMGLENGAQLKSQIEGKLAYYHMINPEKALKLREQLNNVGSQ
jgi:RNA-directed DNA polymerase